MALRPLSSLRDYQPQAIDRIVADRQVAVLLKPGLGKTVCALSALVRLGPNCTLVTAPAQVVESETWSQEAARWEHTRHLRVVEVYGSVAQREKLLAGTPWPDLIVISYENLIWLTDRMPRDLFDALVMDELDKLKHPGTKRFKRMRSGWLLNIPIRIGLTGTPVGNAYQDLFGEMFMVAGPAAGLGRTKEEFLCRYFQQIPMPGAKFLKWTLKPDGSAEEIKRLIKPHAFSLNARLAESELPQVIDNPIDLKMPPHLLEQEKTLRREFELELASGKTITALNNSSLAQKIRQLSSGAVYVAGPEVSPRPWEETHRLKIDALSNLKDELQGEPLLVFYWYQHERARLIRDLGAEDLDVSRAGIQRWQRGEIPFAIAHPLSKGYGVDGLQHGGSNIAWMALPWGRRNLYDQANARLARKGQKQPRCVSHVLNVGKLDRRIWTQILEIGEQEADVMASVEMPLERYLERDGF